MRKRRISADELRYRQALPLDIKVAMSRTRIREFINEYGESGVYVSFSGGKDSTILMHMVRQYYPQTQAVFLDTWMEYPQVRKFTRQFDNVKVIKPEKSMKQIIDDCGWCFPSKDVSEAVEAYRRGLDWAVRKLNGLDKDGKPSEYRQQYKKWLKLAENAPFKISNQCCLEMKENPVQKYERETDRHPILAIMADESARRKEAYLRTGCNSFDTKQVIDPETGEETEIEIARPMSKPMGFWTEQDVLRYIKENHIPIASVYGHIAEVGQMDGQLSLCDTGCPLRLTGERRTGCMFCPVGCHLDGFSKFKRLKKYDPRLYDYCMEELGEKEVLEWIKKNY